MWSNTVLLDSWRKKAALGNSTGENRRKYRGTEGEREGERE
jgi:hypothetical protein